MILFALLRAAPATKYIYGVPVQPS